MRVLNFKFLPQLTSVAWLKKNYIFEKSVVESAMFVAKKKVHIMNYIGVFGYAIVKFVCKLNEGV